MHHRLLETITELEPRLRTIRVMSTLELTCGRVLELLACELAGALEPRLVTPLSAHLARCEECARTRRRLRRCVRRVRAAKPEVEDDALVAPSWSGRRVVLHTSALLATSSPRDTG